MGRPAAPARLVDRDSSPYVASTTVPLGSLVRGFMTGILMMVGQEDRGDRRGVKWRRPVHRLPASCTDWLVAASLPVWAVAAALDVMMGR